MRLPVTARTTLLRELRDEARALYRRGRVIVAVDGPDGAGMSAFADGLAEAYAEDGADVFRASLDGFQRPRAERYARGHDSAEGRYRDSYDYSTLRRVLIDPFREGRQAAASIGFQLAGWDAERDAPVEARWVTGPEDAVLVIDGVFLHRPELRDLWDWSVWLDVPTGVVQRRETTRRAPGSAQELYLREAGPRTRASAIVDNTDPEHPARVFGDYC